MSKHILLADDSAATKTSVENALGPDEYQLITAANGRAAMDQIHDRAPHLVLAHALLPDIDGYDICRQVKENPDTSHIPVLLLTGTFEPFDINRAKEVHYDGFVTKPLDSQELKSLVSRCIEKAVYPAREPETVDPAPDSADASEFSAPSTVVVADDGSDAMLDRIFPDDQPPEQIITDDQDSDDLFSIVDPVSDSEEVVAEPVFESPAVEPSDPDRPSGETVDRRSPDFGIWGTAVEPDKIEAEPAVETPVSDDPAPFAEDSDLSWFLKKYEEKSLAAEESSPDEPAEEQGATEKESTGLFFSPRLDDEPVTEAPPAGIETSAESEPMETVEPLPVASAEETEELPAAVPLVLDEQQLEQISRRVVELLSESVVRDVAWEAVPEIAERLIRERLREIEEEADSTT